MAEMEIEIGMSEIAKEIKMSYRKKGRKTKVRDRERNKDEKIQMEIDIDIKMLAIHYGLEQQRIGT